MAPKGKIEQLCFEPIEEYFKDMQLEEHERLSDSIWRKESNADINSESYIRDRNSESYIRDRIIRTISELSAFSEGVINGKELPDIADYLYETQTRNPNIKRYKYIEFPNKINSCLSSLEKNYARTVKDDEIFQGEFIIRRDEEVHPFSDGGCSINCGIVNRTFPEHPDKMDVIRKCVDLYHLRLNLSVKNKFCEIPLSIFIVPGFKDWREAIEFAQVPNIELIKRFYSDDKRRLDLYPEKELIDSAKEYRK